jgi:hypothetical protein
MLELSEPPQVIPNSLHENSIDAWGDGPVRSFTLLKARIT